MPSAKTQPARGMRDFLPEDVRKREYVIGVIKEVSSRSKPRRRRTLKR
jgi:histidyl-tRNA synthetase